MKAFVAACAAMIVISVGAWAALNNAGFSAAETHSGASVRLSE